MVIYVIYKDGLVICVTTLARVVMDEFKKGIDTVEAWRNDKRIRTFKNPREFNKYINPRPTEDDETGENGYEW